VYVLFQSEFVEKCSYIHYIFLQWCRIDDYITSINDASVTLFGQDLVNVQAAGSSALPPHPPLVSQHSASSVSASGGVGNSGMVASAHGSGKVTATRNKQTNFSVYEDNVLCKSWLEISCDPLLCVM